MKPPNWTLKLTTFAIRFFFSAVTLIGLAWVWFFIPELSGKSLESIDAVFELPWYIIGRKGKELTRDMGGAVESFGIAKGEEADMVEYVTDAERKA